MRRTAARELAPMPVLGDGTVADAARLMGLAARELEVKLPELRLRRPPFPAPDQTTGLLDLDAIVEWRRRRHPELYPLTHTDSARDARAVAGARIRGLFDGKRQAG
jgi:hypothetical protein